MNKRFWIHLPLGFLNIFMLWFSPTLGLLFGAGFVAYEIVQGGKPHHDIKGWLWGLSVGGVAWFILWILAVVFE